MSQNGSIEIEPDIILNVDSDYDSNGYKRKPMRAHTKQTDRHTHVKMHGNLDFRMNSLSNYMYSDFFHFQNRFGKAATEVKAEVKDEPEAYDMSAGKDGFNLDALRLDFSRPLRLDRVTDDGANEQSRSTTKFFSITNRHDQCPYCGKYYRKLSRHILKHTNLPKLFNAEQMQHIQMIQQQQTLYFKKPIKCEQCAQIFDEKAALDEHIKVIHGKPFVCSVCDKGFAQNCNLINHVRTHTGVKPFRCEYCDKRFTQSGNLKNHLRLHNDERPFVCPVCFQAFRQLSNLNNHSKKHPNKTIDFKVGMTV